MKGKSFTLVVPATSANLGSGFDCLGIALDLYNSYTFFPSRGKIEISGCPEEYCNPDHLTVRSFMHLVRKAGWDIPSFKLRMETRVPDCRGLGSSAACILAGLFAANDFMDEPFSPYDLFNEGCKLEGHPDNIAPAFAGGMCTGFFDEKNERYHFLKIPIKNRPRLFALVPEFKIETSKARAVLPSTYSRKEVTVSLQRLSWLLASLYTGASENIHFGFDDALHQPYRSCLIPDWLPITEKLSEFEGLSWFISGSGPTIMIWSYSHNPDIENRLREMMNQLNNCWKIISCGIAEHGIRKSIKMAD